MRGCYLIRQTIAHLYNDEVANQVRILYGGSVNLSNIKTLMQKDDIDGVLIGRASLDATTFLEMVNYQRFGH